MNFIIVGPSADPAHVRGGNDSVAALKAIASARAPFVSRGDNSGTHATELRLWKIAAKPQGRQLRKNGTATLAAAWARRSCRERDGRLHADRPRHLAQLQQQGSLVIAVEGDRA